MFWVCFNLLHQLPNHHQPPSNVPNKKGGLGDRAPVRLVGAEPGPKDINQWCLKDLCDMGSFRKVKKTNHSALTSLFADFRFKYHYWLVVCNIWIIFPYIGNVIIPTDELIFFRGVGIPPTSMDIFHSPLTCQVCEIWWREFNTNMIVIVCDESYS